MKFLKCSFCFLFPFALPATPDYEKMHCLHCIAYDSSGLFQKVWLLFDTRWGCIGEAGREPKEEKERMKELLNKGSAFVSDFSNESTLCMRWPKYWSFSISPSKEHPGLISFRMDWWISLQSKGLSRVFSNTTVQKHPFFGTQLSSPSNSHIHTWLLEKP